MPSSTPDWIHTVFVQEFSDPANKDATVQQVHEKVRRFLESLDDVPHVPGIDWAYKCKRDWKKTTGGAPWRDQQWSLGSSNYMENGHGDGWGRDLVELSILCDSLGTSFTYRQADWAARLLPFVPFGLEERPILRLDWLRFWSTAYSLEEIRSESHGVTPPDTTRLDFLLVTDPWAHTLHLRGRGEQAVSAGNLTVRLAEMAGRIRAPQTWTIAVQRHLYEETHPTAPSSETNIESVSRGWIRYFLGEVAGDQLNITQWRLAAAILEASPRIHGAQIEAEELNQAEDIAKKVVELIVNSKEDRLLKFAEIAELKRSEIYAQFES